VRGEFLKRRRLGDWESVAADRKQEAQARFPVSGTPPGSIRRGAVKGSVTHFFVRNFLNCLGQVPRKVFQWQEFQIPIL
jgi:hypothetical protein